VAKARSSQPRESGSPRPASRPTEQLLQEAQSRAAGEKRFHDLLDAAPDAILEVDSRGRIVRANAAVAELFGYPPAELLNQPVEHLIPEEVRSIHVGHRNGYVAHPVKRPMGSSLDLYALRSDGSRFAVDIVLSPFQLENGQIHTAVVVRDVTAQKQAETELREARQIAESANRAKSEFLASMSHELRSPLNTIMGYTQLLAEEAVGSLNEKQRRFLGHIGKDSQHLLNLINDILDLSKIESGRLELRRESYKLQPLLNDVLSMLRPAAVEKQIHLEKDDHPEAAISGDILRTKQVLINLLSNALKFTPAGGAVTVHAFQDGEQVAICVADTGIGIPQEQLHAIFGRFHQVNSTQQGQKQQGTGLGLAITKSLVEQMGGRIWVESEIGKGSRFTFTLDGRIAPAPAHTRVLVVEDEPLAAQLLEDYLKPEGYQVTVTHNVRFALEALNAQRPDVVILDLLMPGHPAAGLDLLKRLKGLPETKDIPVVIVSVLERTASPATALGAAAHLSKPIHKQHLLETLRELVHSA
jgi:PAS domain S-box-containing protein